MWQWWHRLLLNSELVFTVVGNAHSQNTCFIAFLLKITQNDLYLSKGERETRLDFLSKLTKYECTAAMFLVRGPSSLDSSYISFLSFQLNVEFSIPLAHS